MLFNYRRMFLALILAQSMITTACFAVQDCFITGCNSEICSDMPQEKFGICKWEPAFECYHQYGVCARDESGQCAWVQSPELLACFAKVEEDVAGSE